jgi:hypothetical protein
MLLILKMENRPEKNLKSLAPIRAYRFKSGPRYKKSRFGGISKF